MSDDEAVVRITLRDVYDAVGRLEESFGHRMDEHEATDDRRFESLNLKVYGVLGTVVAAAIAVLVNISGVHL